MKLTDRLKAIKCDKIPPGWLNLDQLAANEGFASADSFRPVLRDCLAAGLLEVRHFRVIWGAQTRLRPHYRYVKAVAR